MPVTKQQNRQRAGALTNGDIDYARARSELMWGHCMGISLNTVVMPVKCCEEKYQFLRHCLPSKMWNSHCVGLLTVENRGTSIRKYCVVPWSGMYARSFLTTSVKNVEKLIWLNFHILNQGRKLLAAASIALGHHTLCVHHKPTFLVDGSCIFLILHGHMLQANF